MLSFCGPLPYRDPRSLVTLTSFASKPSFDSNGSVSHADFEALKAKTRSFDDLAITFRQGWSSVILDGGTGPQRVQGAFVSPNMFAIFGRSPILGRTFTAGENLRAERVVVISQGLWADRFGSSPQALGQDLEMDGRRWRVIGVMPSDFQVPFLDTELWAPMLAHPDWNDPAEKSFPQRPFWDVMARLKPGVSIRVAQAEVNAIESGLRAALPEFHSNNLRIVPLREHFTGDVQRPLWVLFGAVALLLAIACGNVANLLLARAAERGRELAVRTALGAGQKRLIRQLLTEAVTFSCLAGVVGTFAASALLPALKALAPANIPLLQNVELNERCLFFASITSIAIGLLLGVAPAWQMSRRQYLEVLHVAGRRATETRTGRRLKGFLVVVEFALAMVLLSGAGLLFRSFVGVLHTDVGFHPENILTVQLALADATSGPKTAQFYREVIQSIEGMPGVRAVGGVSNLFFLTGKRTHALRQVEGQPPEPESSWKPLVWTQINGAYFQAMGIPLLACRYFSSHDQPNTPPVAIVNETLARRYWPGENPIGHRLKGFDPRGRNDEWVTVVGVVKDTRSGGLEKPAFSQIYEVQDQSSEQIGNFVIRTAADPARIANSVRTLIHQVNRNAIVSSITTMQQLLDRQVVERRFETWLIGVFSAFALSLAALGVFAVMYYSVSSKTHEIGIRMALGARATDMTALVLRQGARLAFTGIVAGSLGALWSSYAIAGMLYKVKPSDPISFLGAGLTLAAIALLGSYVPARRASHVDPTAALRED